MIRPSSPFCWCKHRTSARDFPLVCLDGGYFHFSSSFFYMGGGNSLFFRLLSSFISGHLRVVLVVHFFPPVVHNPSRGESFSAFHMDAHPLYSPHPLREKKKNHCLYSFISFPLRLRTPPLKQSVPTIVNGERSFLCTFGPARATSFSAFHGTFVSSSELASS